MVETVGWRRGRLISLERWVVGRGEKGRGGEGMDVVTYGRKRRRL